MKRIARLLAWTSAVLNVTTLIPPLRGWLGVLLYLPHALSEACPLPPGRPLGSIPGMISGFLGGTPDELPDLYVLGSPIHHVGPHCPPTLLLQGGHDPGGMRPDAIRLHRLLQAAGVKSVYLEYPNTGHGFDLILPRLSPAAQAATYDVERFLASINEVGQRI